jgi:hypothetical protein
MQTDGLEFSDVVGIRCECANANCPRKHYTVKSHLEPGWDMNLIRCPYCTGLPAERPLSPSGPPRTPGQLELCHDVLALLQAIPKLAATQSQELRPKVKLSLEVRSKA